MRKDAIAVRCPKRRTPFSISTWARLMPCSKVLLREIQKETAIIVNLDITNDFWKQSASNDSCR
ncbi:MAG: hypothetical protein ACETWE_06455 [Candidatus Bathyarchaeia archaeon]